RRRRCGHGRRIIIYLHGEEQVGAGAADVFLVKHPRRMLGVVDDELLDAGVDDALHVRLAGVKQVWLTPAADVVDQARGLYDDRQIGIVAKPGPGRLRRGLPGPEQDGTQNGEAGGADTTKMADHGPISGKVPVLRTRPWTCARNRFPVPRPLLR